MIISTYYSSGMKTLSSHEKVISQALHISMFIEDVLSFKSHLSGLKHPVLGAWEAAEPCVLKYICSAHGCVLMAIIIITVKWIWQFILISAWESWVFGWRLPHKVQMNALWLWCTLHVSVLLSSKKYWINQMCHSFKKKCYILKHLLCEALRRKFCGTVINCLRTMNYCRTVFTWK